ncbi:MAG TPA: terminase [Balneola sp.]|nr:terminase [Balneola sp.]
MSNNLENSLNIEKTETKNEVVRKPPVEIVVSDEVRANKKQNDANKDYAEVRDNLKNIIGTGLNAIDGILSVASEGESPRAYEVVSQLIKSVTDANKDLIGLHEQMKKLDEDTGGRSSGPVTNNSIFVGSTKELQKLVKNNFKQLEDEANGES